LNDGFKPGKNSGRELEAINPLFVQTDILKIEKPPQPFPAKKVLL